VRTRRVHARKKGHIDGSTGAKVVKTILKDHNDAGRTGYSEVGEWHQGLPVCFLKLAQPVCFVNQGLSVCFLNLLWSY